MWSRGEILNIANRMVHSARPTRDDVQMVPFPAVAKKMGFRSLRFVSIEYCFGKFADNFGSLSHRKARDDGDSLGIEVL